MAGCSPSAIIRHSVSPWSPGRSRSRTTTSYGLRLILAAASSPSDNNALHERLSAPQHAGLMTRLRHADDKGELRVDTDLNAIANALIGTLLLEVLNGTTTGDVSRTRYNGLLNAVLQGVSDTAGERGGE